MAVKKNQNSLKQFSQGFNTSEKPLDIAEPELKEEKVPTQKFNLEGSPSQAHQRTYDLRKELESH